MRGRVPPARLSQPETSGIDKHRTLVSRSGASRPLTWRHPDPMPEHPELLSDWRDIAVLHGDLHHDNVLDFGPERSWLAIDPKGLIGERGFDFASLFLNPDLADPSRPVAADRNRFLKRLAIVTEKGKLERNRLLKWILAWSGLSSVWSTGDAQASNTALTISRFAQAELDR